MRSLVGHTSIALTSIGAYLKVPAEREDIASAADIYALVHQFASSAESTAGNEEAGRRAATELGSDPAAALDGLVKTALSDLAGSEDQLITVAGGVDIARAAGVQFELPAMCFPR